MEASFLKENVIQSRQNDKTGKNALKLVKYSKQNEFLFEKNISQFIELLDFLNSKDDVLAITGYTLCGKTLLTSSLEYLIDEKTILHFFKCTPCTTLDDILLAFFDTFKNYAQKKLVHIPKIETQNFQEKISVYLSKCENPIIIVLDGLNEIEIKKNKDEIMNFISHAACLKNIKLIISTRAFDISDLKNINLRLKTSIIKPLTLENLKEYCLVNVINSENLEEFYKLSRGHYFNLSLTMSYIQPTNITIKEFVDEVKASIKNIDELVVLKNLSLIPQSYFQILWLACLANFGMPKKNLLLLPDSDEEQISFLQKRGIIDIINDCIYVKDYFKKEIIKSIEPLAQKNIIKGIIKFLESQLPLKPSLREVNLSRVTIRNEIERLNSIINKEAIKLKDKNKSSYLTILGYSKQFKTNWDGFDDIIMPKSQENVQNVKNENIEQKTDDIVAEESKEDLAKDNEFQTKITALEFAKMLKNKYEYSDALVQYSDALSEAIENSNKASIISILKDTAECYFKLGDYQNAIENYGKAHEVAKNESLIDECYEIILKIAEVYKSIYKKDLAEEIYKDIIDQNNINAHIKLRAKIDLFELNFAKNKPEEIVQTYYSLLQEAEDDEKLSSKIHFRLGYLYDKSDSIELAIKHYKLSIEKCSDYRVNENISSCYYNLAEIYSEIKDYDNALDFYLKSLSIDEITKNVDGMLITVKKIAKLYERKDSKLALDYYKKSLELVKSLNDNYPLACAYLDIGDYYYRQKKDIDALNYYMNAKKIMANQLTNENKFLIDERINDLKVRMGKDIVEKLITEFS